jgi:hypothetical protein
LSSQIQGKNNIRQPPNSTSLGRVYIQGSFTPSKDVTSCSIELTSFVFYNTYRGCLI